MAPAIAIAYLLVLIVVAAVGATFVPKLIDEVNGFVQATPGYVHDLTHGRGRLGFLERKYHVVEKVQEQVKAGGAKKVLGLSGAAVTVTKSILTIIAATVTIVFLTFFMLLEGRSWVDPPPRRPAACRTPAPGSSPRRTPSPPGRPWPCARPGGGSARAGRRDR